MTAQITAEPRVYGPANPEFSYWQDKALATLPGQRGHDEAVGRLRRHGLEVETEVRSGTPEGRRSSAVLRQVGRYEGRVLSSGTTSGGAFVTPDYMTGAWAPYRTPGKSFTNQTTKLPLPDFGMVVHVPSFTGTTGAGQQTENQGVSETDPTGSDISTPLVLIAGNVPISQQLFDRGGLSGLAFDAILGRQLMLQLNTQIDIYALTQVLANAGTVTDTSFTMAKFYADLALGREILTDSNGVRLAATHVFSTSDQFGFITRQLDSENRPIVTPDSNALVAAADDPSWESWTGVHLPGALRWYTDDNIPALSTNTQILVARPQEIYTFEGDPISYAMPETNAPELSVLVGLRCYIGVVARFPKAVVSISGAAYPLSNL